MIDTHVHSLYSHDGRVAMPEMIQAACAQGIGVLGITDHLDRDVSHYPELDTIHQLDVDEYFAALTECAKAVPQDMTFLRGIEVSYDVTCLQENSDIVRDYPFDYIINAVHTCGGRDPYADGYFDGFDKQTAYGDFLAKIRDSLDAPYDYQIIAHIGYIARTSPYTDSQLRYADFHKVIDDILTGIIARDKTLEVNSHSRGREWSAVNDEQIFRRYYELGGRSISFGSDAHVTARLCDKYSTLSYMMTQIGFTEWTYYVNGQAHFAPIKL